MDRRKMLALLGASPALVAGAPSYARTAPASSKAAGSSVVSGRMITAVNPGITPILATRIPLAPRLDTLDGKTIYLVDTDWGGMGQNGSILEEMQAWFAEHMPSVTTVRRKKTGNIFRDDTKDVWNEIKEKGQAAILGVAG